MVFRLVRAAKRFYYSFWFVPTIFILSAIVLSEGTVALDRHLWPDTGKAITLWSNPIFDLGSSGSRTLLSAIGGTMLGVAGTAFSITISVIATASTTYGPRLVRNFMADRGNQIVLGMLSSTFVFTVLVLRTIRAANDDGLSAFVPYLAVNVALIAAIADVFALVYFINHVASSIQVDNLASSVRARLLATVDSMYPSQAADHWIEAEPFAGGTPICLGKNGYIGTIDYETLAKGVARAGAQLRLTGRPGDHLVADEPLGYVRPADKADKVSALMKDNVEIVNARSSEQDVRWAGRQVMELAVRALSPGTNDPYTAVNAIEEIASGICMAVQRPDPADAVLVDGHACLFTSPVSLEELIDLPFDNVRPFIAGQPLVLDALIALAGRIEAVNTHRELAGRAWHQVEVAIESYRRENPPDFDLQRIEKSLARHRRWAEQG